jgi:signal recognition particle GTPase
MELAKLNNNLSDNIIDYDEEERKRELRKELINSIAYIQNPSVGEKEVAYFEYNNGNSEMEKRCISNITAKYKEEQDQQTATSIKNIQEMLLEYNIPNEIAKELAILFLKDKIVD